MLHPILLVLIATPHCCRLPPQTNCSSTRTPPPALLRRLSALPSPTVLPTSDTRWGSRYLGRPRYLNASNLSLFPFHPQHRNSTPSPKTPETPFPRPLQHPDGAHQFYARGSANYQISIKWKRGNGAISHKSSSLNPQRSPNAFPQFK